MRSWLEHYGGLFTPAVRASIAETKQGERHAILLAIVARLVPAQWSDTDILALVLPAAVAAWQDVCPAELSIRLDRQLAWMRLQEAAKYAGPVSPRAARLAIAFGSKP
jgi:hypothetical protein